MTQLARVPSHHEISYEIEGLGYAYLVQKTVLFNQQQPGRFATALNCKH